MTRLEEVHGACNEVDVVKLVRMLTDEWADPKTVGVNVRRQESDGLTIIEMWAVPLNKTILPDGAQSVSFAAAIADDTGKDSLADVVGTAVRSSCVSAKEMVTRAALRGEVAHA